MARIAGFITIAVLFPALCFGQERPRVEIPHGDVTFVLTADTIEGDLDQNLVAEGNVVAAYSNAKLTAQRIVYQPKTDTVLIEGDFEIVRDSGWLRGSRAELQIKDDTGVIYDASGYTDEELYVQVEKLTKIGPKTYLAESGYLTSCEDRVPKWSFRIARATIRLEATARLKNTVFKVKKVPIFYFPYLILPTAKKERSSGFLLPTIGRSNNKGTRLSQRFYLVMGRSADLMLEGHYYSQRGWGGEFNFRTRPNEVTVLDLSGDFVEDRRGQGGASVYGIGYTKFRNGFRAIADFNLVTNFTYRQVFSDNFFTATRPTENSRVFLTNHFRTGAFNIFMGREETIFPKQNTVTQTVPEIDFKFIGMRLGRSPFYLDLDTSMAGLGRTDVEIETPTISQRLDLYPRIYASLPLFQGLQLSPSLGIRETFYSDSIETGDGGRRITGDSVQRRYLHLSVELKGWGLSRVYGETGGGRWKHLIEPVVKYRYISGIDNFDRIIRFDSLDAVANTSEFEYALFNRIFFKGSPSGGAREWLSVKIGQKYFFDPSFGGALKEGAINQFFPLNTLTGLPYATSERDLSPVTTAVRFNPNPRISLDMRGDFDSDKGEFTNLSVTGFYRRDLLSVGTTYFVTRELVEGLGDSNQVQARVGVGDFGKGFSTSIGLAYDAQVTRLLNHLVRVSYFWDCCGVSAEVSGFDLSTRQERQIRFAFFLKGIGSFGNLRQTEHVF